MDQEVIISDIMPSNSRIFRASVTQWDGDDWTTQGKVLSRRLVRYRLCPWGSCDGSSDTGCSSKYGDYVVDLNTFLYQYYLSAKRNANEVIDTYCQEEWDGNGSYDSCYDKCFSNNGGFTSTASSSVEDGVDSYDFDPLEFAQCGAFDDDLYLGPYFSDDGQSVHLGIFSDYLCSTFSSCDATCFYNTYNSTLAYDGTSMVSNNCLSCSDITIQDGYERTSAREECTAIYGDSGKCETKMWIDYPNESGCTYIQGLKSIGYDGVISTKGAKKSKEAGLVIGLLSFSSMILAIYVHFLYSKLDRAKYHLEKEQRHEHWNITERQCQSDMILLCMYITIKKLNSY